MRSCRAEEGGGGGGEGLSANIQKTIPGLTSRSP